MIGFRDFNDFPVRFSNAVCLGWETVFFGLEDRVYVNFIRFFFVPFSYFLCRKASIHLI